MTHQRQRALPVVPSTKDAAADMYERIVRIDERLKQMSERQVRTESRLVRLLLANDLDENGFPVREPTIPTPF